MDAQTETRSFLLFPAIITFSVLMIIVCGYEFFSVEPWTSDNWRFSLAIALLMIFFGFLGCFRIFMVKLIQKFYHGPVEIIYNRWPGLYFVYMAVIIAGLYFISSFIPLGVDNGYLRVTNTGVVLQEGQRTARTPFELSSVQFQLDSAQRWKYESEYPYALFSVLVGNTDVLMVLDVQLKDDTVMHSMLASHATSLRTVSDQVWSSDLNPILSKLIAGYLQTIFQGMQGKVTGSNETILLRLGELLRSNPLPDPIKTLTISHLFVQSVQN